MNGMAPLCRVAKYQRWIFPLFIPFGFFEAWMGKLLLDHAFFVAVLFKYLFFQYTGTTARIASMCTPRTRLTPCKRPQAQTSTPAAVAASWTCGGVPVEYSGTKLERTRKTSWVTNFIFWKMAAIGMLPSGWCLTTQWRTCTTTPRTHLTGKLQQKTFMP